MRLKDNDEDFRNSYACKEYLDFMASVMIDFIEKWKTAWSIYIHFLTRLVVCTDQIVDDVRP